MLNPPPDNDHPDLEQLQSRLALKLFALYLLAYAGFMGLSAFAPEMMAKAALLGVNLAIIYGLGLIVGAVVLALVYMVLCHRIAQRFHAENRQP